jgi:hypothetical protein
MPLLWKKATTILTPQQPVPPKFPRPVSGGFLVRLAFAQPTLLPALLGARLSCFLPHRTVQPFFAALLVPHN